MSADVLDVPALTSGGHAGTRTVGAWTPSLLLLAAGLVGSLVSWRHGVYYAGGVDSVVLGKAALLLLTWAATIVFSSRMTGRRPIGGRTVAFLGVYLVATLFGAAAAGSLVPSLVLAIRVVIVALIVIRLVRVLPGLVIFNAIATVMGIIAVAAAVTGIPAFAKHSRLAGGIPPLAWNELALLCAVPLLALGYRALQGQGHSIDLVPMATLAGILWLTGSRTGVAALALALVVMILQVRPLQFSTALAMLVAAPVGTYILFGSPLISHYLGRGGSQDVSTLSNRTLAWSAAFQLPDSVWRFAFGAGLSVKRITVNARWWDTQGLDSSWISAFVQAGAIGMAVFGIWALFALGSSFRSGRPDRLVWSSVTVYLIARSYLESGLLDASAQFLIFFLICLQSERRTRESEHLVGAATRTARRVSTSPG